MAQVLVGAAVVGRVGRVVWSNRESVYLNQYSAISGL